MCGIIGFNWRNKELGERMNSCITHRGPDAGGVFDEEGITLGNRRLAVIDLRAEANQPMSVRGLTIVYNGEIYNYKELKSELRDYEFKTESDTEVILAGYQKWGKDVVHKLNGIFAFAIWDKGEGKLFCARDHMGVKPFYYFWDGQKFIFASEIKSIFEHDVLRRLNLDAFNRFMRVLYSPEPETLLQNIFKLSPGSALTLKDNKLEIIKYYEPKLNLKKWRYNDAVEVVHDAVAGATERQLVADVPVGVYLSGGIDSSTVLASVSRVKKDVKTFSIGFDLEETEDREKFNRDFDLAAETAKYFGSDHQQLILNAREVAGCMEDIIASIDDPISNPTTLPMAFLSKFAKKQVTVALSGNGGDELFGGYERYRTSRRLDIIGRIPGAEYLLPKKIRAGLKMSSLDRLIQFEFEKDHRLSRVMNTNYFKAVDRVKGLFEKYMEGYSDKTEALMLADVKGWLPDQALSLGDKMSMHGSLEERVPFLDRQVVDLAMSLPVSYKVTPFTTKKILKDAFKNELPPKLFREPKRGWFSPGAKWIRRPEIERIFRDVLSPDYYAGTTDLFNWGAVKQMLGDHISKKEYNLTILWAILTFQIWARRYSIHL